MNKRIRSGPSSRTIFFVLAAAFLAVGLVAGGIWYKGRDSRLMNRASDYFEKGQYEEAKIEYMNLLKRDPRNATALARMGIIWYDQGAVIRSYPFLLEAVKVDTENLAVRNRLSKAQLAMRLTDDARIQAVEVLKRSSDDVEAAMILSETASAQDGANDLQEQFSELGVPTGSVAFLLANAQATLQGSGRVEVEQKSELLEKAAAAVKRALEVDPNSSLAHGAMGNLHMLREKWDEAEVSYKTASALAPRHSSLRLRHASFLMQRGELEEAKAELTKITADAPDLMHAWQLLANIGYMEKNMDVVIANLEKILALDPLSYAGRILQAQAYLFKGDPASIEKAIQDLEDLRRVYLNNPTVDFQLARGYAAKGEAVKAITVLNSCLSEQPDHSEAMLLRAQLNLRNGNPEAVVTDMKALVTSQVADGENESDDEVPAQAGSIQAELLLVDAYRNTGRLDEAADRVRALIERDESVFKFHFFLGVVLRQQNKIQEARDAFTKARLIEPGNPLAIYQLFELDLAEMKYDSAMAIVLSFLEKAPASPFGNFMLGQVYAAQGDLENAESALLKAVQSHNSFMQAEDLLTAIYSRTGRLQQAVDRLEPILQKRTNDESRSLKLAALYERIGEYEKASATYEKAISLNTNLAPAFNNLAWIYSEHLNKPAAALEAAQKARALLPEEGPIADTLGWILYKDGDYPRALALVQEAAGKLPDVPEVQYHLGMVRYKMGQPALAKEAFEKALASEVEFRGKEEVRTQLKLLDSGSDLTVATINELLKKNPDDLLLKMRLAGLLRAQGDFGKAAEACQEALKENPDLAQAHVMLAELYGGPLWDPEAAITATRKARSLLSNDPKVGGILGAVALRCGDAAWGYDLLKSVAAELPGDATVLYNLASASYAVGNAREARRTLEELLNIQTIESGSPVIQKASALRVMLNFLRERTELENAVNEARKSLEESPGFLPASMVIAASHFEREDVEKSIAAYIEILNSSPEFVLVQKELAMIYARNLERQDEAYELAAKARTVIRNDLELNWAFAHVALGRDESYARQLLNEIVTNNKPETSREWFCYGHALLALSERAKSSAAFKQALDGGLQGILAKEAREQLAELR